MAMWNPFDSVLETWNSMVACVSQAVQDLGAWVLPAQAEGEPEEPLPLALVSCIGGASVACSLAGTAAVHPGLWSAVLGHATGAECALVCSIGTIGILGFVAAQAVLVGYDYTVRPLGARLTGVYALAAGVPVLAHFAVRVAAAKYALWVDGVGLLVASGYFSHGVDCEQRNLIQKACLTPRRGTLKAKVFEKVWRRSTCLGPLSSTVVAKGGMRTCVAFTAVWAGWLPTVF